MPSKWPILCCTCDTEEKYKTAYARASAKARNKNANGNKATWTRRSLLEHEQSEFQETQVGHLVSQIKHGDHKSGNDQHNGKRRTHVQEMFHHNAPQSHVTSTTFPWMNEDFNVSNSRSVTHLGISSVKINAKRNEQANKNNFHVLIDKASAGNKDSRKIPLTSKSFSEPKDNNGAIYRKPMIRTNATQNNARTVPNGYTGNTKPIYHSIAHATVNKGPPVVSAPSAYGQSGSDQPLVLHAPCSNVGVRVTHTGSNKVKQIPKLGDYLVLKPDRSGGGSMVDTKDVLDGHQGAVRAPIPAHMRDITADNQSDISFTSEITFRKANISFEMNDLSLKRSKRPGIFSTHNNHKYERLSGVKPDSKVHSNHANEPAGNVGSMYGYIPKAVQNVHASNALSGGQIDDFFLQRMNDREMETFGTIDRKDKKDWGDFMDANYIGDKGIKEMTKPGTVDANKTPNNNDATVGNKNKTDCTDTPRFGLQQIKLKPPPNKQMVTAMTQPRSAHYAETGLNSPDSFRDENENKVIMIDFPPNLRKTVPGKISPTRIHENGDVNTGKITSEDIPIANILSESEQVFY